MNLVKNMPNIKKSASEDSGHLVGSAQTARGDGRKVAAGLKTLAF